MQEKFQRKINHSLMIVEKEYFSIKISTSLIFHLFFFFKKRVLILYISRTNQNQGKVVNKNSTAHSPQIKKYFRCPRFKLAAEVKELASNTAVRSNQFYCTRDPIELQQHYDQKGNNVSSRLRNPTVLYQNKIQHHPN